MFQHFEFIRMTCVAIQMFAVRIVSIEHNAIVQLYIQLVDSLRTQQSVFVCNIIIVGLAFGGLD